MHTAQRREPPAVALLREHGLEGEGLLDFCDLVAGEMLRRYGATLGDARREDLVSYLVERALRIAGTWQPETGASYSFRSWLGAYLKFRVIDYWRSELGDARYPRSRGTLRGRVLRLEGLPEHGQPAVTDSYFGSIPAAAGSGVPRMSRMLVWCTPRCTPRRDMS